MDFLIDNLWVINIWGVEIWITRTIFNTWIIMALLIIAAVIVRISMRKFKEVPKGFQGAVEASVEIFDNFVFNSGGEKLMPLSSWFFTIFIFIMFSSIMGIFGLRPPTADWATTFAFAMATFTLIQIFGIRYRKGAYLKGFFQPNFIFFPLNFIGELARPISLSFRLFGNMLAGMILMSLIYSLAPIVVRIGLPVALHGYFDLFSGAVQTYIFTILSIMFVRGAAEEDA